jgi:glycosyltransferase involved in cell wall biosynthesis
MMHVFVNGLAASAGGGLTYLRNVLPHLAAKSKLKVTVALSRDLREECQALEGVESLALQVPVARRFWYEQSSLPGILRDSKADVLLSTGNFALRRSPVPQVLLSRNSIYLSSDFYKDLRSRSEYRMWVNTHMRAVLARRSIAWADVTVAPSEAFASDLERWTGRPVRAIHHGFDREVFTRDAKPLPLQVEEQLNAIRDSPKLLFVSHYNYYRNFETLIRALPLLRGRIPGRSPKLLLTCHLQPRKNPGAYDPSVAAELIRKLNAQDLIVELGYVPYEQLHHLYARADLYVTPAYTETFSHPLVEAMASGVPVVASDLAVHREICGDAASYFSKFSPKALSESITQVLQKPETARQMSQSALERSRRFSWKAHVEKILDVCETALAQRRTANEVAGA